MVELPRSAIIIGVFTLLVVFLHFSLSYNNVFAQPEPGPQTTANNYTKDDYAAKFSCFEKDDKDNLIVNKTTGLLTPCKIDTGDNAWMLTSSALVLMMTPGGLAIFYSGLARQKNAVNTLHMVFITTGIIGV